MKINRQPAAIMADDIVSADHRYWSAFVDSALGPRLKDDTSVEQIGAFAVKTFGKHDFDGFTGDREFVLVKDPQKAFSKLRGSIGCVYLWRSRHSRDASERERMAREAEFAFRQAWALCPYSPEVVFHYVDLLTSEMRFSEALKVVRTASSLDAEHNASFSQSIEVLDAISFRTNQGGGAGQYSVWQSRARPS